MGEPLAKHIERSLIGVRVRVWFECGADFAIATKKRPDVEGFVRAVDGISLLVQQDLEWGGSWQKNELVHVDPKSAGGILVVGDGDVWSAFPTAA